MSIDKDKSAYNEENGYLSIFNYKNLATIWDGNCWFWTLSLHFDGIEDNYAQYRKEVYEYCKRNKEDLREFFVQEPSNNKDEILENYDFDEYIE